MKTLLPVAFAAVVAATQPAWAQSARATPNQMLDAVLQPVHDALTRLSVTDAERQGVADLLSQGETLAAQVVAARQHGDTAGAQEISRQIELLARVVRGRVEAQRVEARADASEQAALAAEDHRVQARAALERAAEHALEAERPAPPPAMSAPAPAPAHPTDAPAAHPATPAHRGPTHAGSHRSHGGAR